MTLAEDLEDTLSMVATLVLFVALLFDLHAVVGSLGALYMELDLAVLLVALDASSHCVALLAADHTALIKLLEIHLVHPNRRLRCDDRPLHPHRAAVVNPVVLRVCQWCCLLLKKDLVPLDEVCIIFRNVMVLLLMLVEYELKLFLDLDMKLSLGEDRQVSLLPIFLILLLLHLNLDQFVIILFQTLLVVCLFSDQKLAKTRVVLKSSEDSIFTELIIVFLNFIRLTWR